MPMARLVLIFSVAASIVIGTLGVQALAADEPSLKNDLSAETQLAQTTKPPKAKSTLLFKQKLEGLPGLEVRIILVEGPPGWVGGRHYHPGHIFGYVLEGTYELNFEDLTAKTIKAGEVFYESPNTVMRSRNGSLVEPEKNIVIQILREGQPVTVSVK